VKRIEVKSYDQISGEVDWEQKSYSVTGSGSHSLLWEYVKDGSGDDGDDCGWVDYLQGPGSAPLDPLAECLDCDLTITTGGDAYWYSITGSESSYYDNDATYSDSIDDDEETWMQTTVTAVAGDKVSFYWKVSSEEDYDYLKFYIDDQYQDQISGEEDWQKKSYSLSAGSRTLKWVYSKNSSGTEGDDCGWVDGLLVGIGSLVIPPDDNSEAVDSHLKFTESGDGSWFVASGSGDEYYYDGDALYSNDTLDNDEESCLQTIVESDSSETIKFHWKVSSESGSDYLKFYIDDSLEDSISGEVDWQQKSYTVSSGIHTLKWVYVKDGSGEDGDDCGWVDFVQWSGPSPKQDTSNWQTINYKHDVTGQRSEKKVDGFSTRYLYDGPQVIAEYDGNNNLLRKYIYGPGIDQPVCMIEEAESETYYYHYDGLGSVVALSDSAGDTVQTYQYSVYGQVAVYDPNHPNPYMFAGRRFDIEIGLYYNYARYYNPYTGRFLQADPIGYDGGMNLYRYCNNNPLNATDPFGLFPSSFTARVEWLIFPEPRFGKTNWGKVTLKCPYDYQTFKFNGIPKCIPTHGSRGFWRYTEVVIGPTYYVIGYLQYYKVTVKFRWEQGVPKPPGLPGWVPWPHYYMTSKITVRICSDGNSNGTDGWAHRCNFKMGDPAKFISGWYVKATPRHFVPN